jgi:hypothetical protein
LPNVNVANAIRQGIAHPATTQAPAKIALEAVCAIAQLFATAEITKVMVLVAAVARPVASATAAVANKCKRLANRACTCA